MSRLIQFAKMTWPPYLSAFLTNETHFLPWNHFLLAAARTTVDSQTGDQAHDVGSTKSRISCTKIAFQPIVVDAERLRVDVVLHEATTALAHIELVMN